jgi:hypothetical protein
VIRNKYYVLSISDSQSSLCLCKCLTRHQIGEASVGRFIVSRVSFRCLLSPDDPRHNSSSFIHSLQVTFALHLRQSAALIAMRFPVVFLSIYLFLIFQIKSLQRIMLNCWMNLTWQSFEQYSTYLHSVHRLSFVCALEHEFEFIQNYSKQQLILEMKASKTQNFFTYRRQKLQCDCRNSCFNTTAYGCSEYKLHIKLVI